MADFRFEPSVRVPSYFPPEGLSSGIAFVAQSPGKREVEQLTPLVGASGQLLKECCEVAGVSWLQSYRGNVIGFRPPGNDFGFFCGKKAEVGGKDYPHPPISAGKYLRLEWFDELDRMQKELVSLKPNVVVALGNEAMWALTRQSGITKWRGAVMESSAIPGQKVLPTWHPAGVLRAYEHRLDLILDLIKALSESAFPEVRQLHREMWIYPEVEDLWRWEKEYGSPGALLSVDIENPRRMFKCIAFAFDKQHSLCVPFWSDIRPGHSYWREPEDEVAAWDFVQHMLSAYPILGQNYYAYDNWVMLREFGIASRHMREDTMIQHHAHHPELTKDLGYLSSIYCNVPAYKTFRPRGQKAEKRDE
jgi:uracil-DNA glycosylase